MSGHYAITVSGGAVLHAVAGEMTDYKPWQDAVPTLCGRHLVPSNYFKSLDDYRRSYNMFGKSCQQGCEKAWPEVQS